MIFTVVKDVLFSLYSRRSQDEAILAYDYKLTSQHEALMKLCFSPLANWLLFVWAILLFVNPFRFQFPLLSQFPVLLSYIYAPNWALGLSVGIILGYFLRLNNIAIAILLYFVSQAEIHVVIAVFVTAGVIVGQLLNFTKLLIKLEKKIKKTLAWYTAINFTAVAVALYLNTQLYILLDINGYFSASLFNNRFEFFVTALALFYLIQFMMLSVWGHFYVRMKVDPSAIEVHYSTVQIFKNLSVRSRVQAQLEDIIVDKLRNLKDQMADSAAQYLPSELKKKAEQELKYLELAKEELV